MCGVYMYPVVYVQDQFVYVAGHIYSLTFHVSMYTVTTIVVMIAVAVYCPQSYEITETYVLVSQTGEGDCQPHLFSVTASNDAGTSPASTIMESIPICESCPVCEQLHTYIHTYIHDVWNIPWPALYSLHSSGHWSSCQLSNGGPVAVGW